MNPPRACPLQSFHPDLAPAGLSPGKRAPLLELSCLSAYLASESVSPYRLSDPSAPFLWGRPSFRSARLSGPEVFPTRTRAARVTKRPSARRLALSFRVQPEPAVATAAATALVGLRSPSALAALEARSTPVCLAGHLPSSGFRTLLTACFFQGLPALFHAGNALGVFPSGPFPLTELSRSLERLGLRGVSRASWPPHPSKLTRGSTHRRASPSRRRSL